MANRTANLKLNTFLESEPVDFSDINNNALQLDGMNICTYGGQKTANYSGGSSTTARWHCKQFVDGSVDMSAKLDFTTLMCNNGTASPYYSTDVQVYFPIIFSEIFDVQCHMASSNAGYVANVTGKDILDHITIRVMSPTNETSNIYKGIYINVKGTAEPLSDVIINPLT